MGDFKVPYILYQKKDTVVTITLNRPKRLNAIGMELTAQLLGALEQFEKDPDAHVSILTGKGRAFSVGMDLKDLEKTENQDEDPPGTLQKAMRQVTKPMVAAVNGLAMGTGLWLLVMHCDLRIACESATFGMPEINLAIPAVARHFLKENIPLSAAVEMVLMGEPISARRAYDIGLINRVVPDKDLMSAARKIAERIASLSPWAVKLVRQDNIKVMQEAEKKWDLKGNMHIAPELGAEDYQEAVHAFLEKRRPVFKGR